MRAVGGMFFVNAVVQGIPGVVTMVFNDDDPIADEEALMEAWDAGAKVWVPHMVSRQSQATQRGIMSIKVDAEDMDMGRSRYLDFSRIVTMVDDFNEVGDDHALSIIAMLEAKGAQQVAEKSGIILTDAPMPDAETAEKQMRAKGAAERGLKDGSAKLTVERGGKGR